MDEDEDEPTLGVREPRRPIPPTLSPGAEAEPPARDYEEYETYAEGACVK